MESRCTASPVSIHEQRQRENDGQASSPCAYWRVSRLLAEVLLR